MVGSAKGRSTRPSNSFLPRKSSRTKTQATAKPMTAPMTQTMAEMASVNLSVAIDSGAVTWSQKVPKPLSNALEKIAAIGSKTRTDSQRSEPPASTPPTGTLRRRRGAGRAGAAERLATRRHALGLLDGGHHRVLRVEELRVGLVPAAEVVDGEEARGGRELLGVDERLDHRPVALGGEDLLPLVGAGEVEEGLGVLLVLRVGGDRGRVLDEDRVVRRDVVDVLAVELGADGLVLVGDEDVALAAGERGQRVTARLGLDGDVLEQVGQLLLGLVGRAALVQERPVGGHDVPLGRAGGEHVRRDDVDARLEQVVPALDPLRVALADHQGGDRVGD